MRPLPLGPRLRLQQTVPSHATIVACLAEGRQLPEGLSTGNLEAMDDLALMSSPMIVDPGVGEPLGPVLVGGHEHQRAVRREAAFVRRVTRFRVSKSSGLRSLRPLSENLTPENRRGSWQSGEYSVS